MRAWAVSRRYPLSGADVTLAALFILYVYATAYAGLVFVQFSRAQRGVSRLGDSRKRQTFTASPAHTGDFSSLFNGAPIAAFLWAQMEAADDIMAARRATWQRYRKALAPLKRAARLRRPALPDTCQGNAHLYYVLLPDAHERTAFVDSLRQQASMPSSITSPCTPPQPGCAMVDPMAICR